MACTGKEHYSIPDIIFSNSSHHGTWLSCFACSISWVFFSLAAMIVSADCLGRYKCVFANVAKNLRVKDMENFLNFWYLFVYSSMLR